VLVAGAATHERLKVEAAYVAVGAVVDVPPYGDASTTIDGEEPLEVPGEVAFVAVTSTAYVAGARPVNVYVVVLEETVTGLPTAVEVPTLYN
jgi:hypothetical protein